MNKTITQGQKDDLLQQAWQAMGYAYSPYSQFKVGAALLSDTGEVFLGCNIENVSFGATNCAERTAIFNGVSKGFQNFIAIAVVGENEDGTPLSDGYAFPCGICRQVLCEFCAPDCLVLLGSKEKAIFECNLSDLLPYNFAKFT